MVLHESVHRRVQAGQEPRSAASQGTDRVATALFAGTLSILSVFVPIAFMQGMIGRYFFEYGLAISFATLVVLLWLCWAYRTRRLANWSKDGSVLTRKASATVLWMINE